jgi:Carboxypeptidase regulatory-like domain
MPQPISRLFRATSVRLFVLGVLALLAGAHPSAVHGQTAGEGSITGTVTDGTGAVVGDAKVTATNAATNISTTRTSSRDGLFTIAPLNPGTYSVTVEAKGFKTLKQENLDVVGLGVLAFNPTLSIGTATETVNVTAAPPVLDTESAILGAVMENAVYANLPLFQSTTQQRDPTAFATLVPGAQGGSRTPLIGGTANYNGYLYLDGVPSETINQQGDNRTVALNVSPEAVDQFQVNTSVPPAEYMGAGSMNFTIKSGGLRYHGQVSGFLRNTVFEAWTFSQKASTVKNSAGQNVPAPKAVEHPSEISASIGGYVPHAAHKVFFFFAYDRYHSRFTQNPALTTIPSTLMLNGDFTEFNGSPGTGLSGIAGDPSGGIIPGSSPPKSYNPAFLFDPTTNNCVGTVCTRQPFQGVKNGLPTYNVIPVGDISPITQKMESFWPNYNNPTAANYNSSTITNNYLSTGIGGRDNHLYDYRVDIDLTAKNRISAVGAMGQVVYTNNFSSPYLPAPYTIGDYAIIVPKQFDVEDAYIITPHLTNQFKWGYTRFYMPIISASDTSHGYGSPSQTIGAFGVTNLPGGQTNTEFPDVTFGTSKAAPTAPNQWGPNGNQHSTQLTIPNNYSLVDNVQWVKGRHVMTFGITYQFQGLNNANPATYTGVLTLPFNQSPTANFTANSSNIDTSGTGYGYASFLLGAVDPVTLPLQNVATIYSRIKPFAPFVEDSWRVNPKLVVDAGLRWDYLPPLHEKFNHFTYLNPTLTNSATGTPGALEFGGNYGGSAVSCGCKTTSQTYWKNWGPRLGIVYSVNDKTLFRAAAGMVYSQGGGTGGGRVAGYLGSNGAPQVLGFNVTATSPSDIVSGASAGPSFWLNTNAGYLGAKANTSLFGQGYTYPVAPPPGPSSQIIDTGNYINSSGAFVPLSASGIGYVDPYFGGRAPEYTFWNAGFERTITRDMTLQVNYVGDESHHTYSNGTSNARGYWNNQLNPAYLAALGGVNVKNGASTVPLLLAPATSANVAILDGVLPSAPNPASFIAAANASPSNAGVSIGQMLTAFPQYLVVNDALGGSYVDNFSYNALQITLSQRTAHGLTFNVNYTYSKNIGDDTTFRNGFNIPAAAVDGHGQDWHQDRIDRSWTLTSLPQLVNAYGVYKLPIGTPGHFGGNSLLTRELVGGWQLSGIYTYTSGSPFAVTWTTAAGCANAPVSSPLLGPTPSTCMPSVAPGFVGSARINGSYGSGGSSGFTACNIGIGAGCTARQYVTPTAFAVPGDLSTASGFHQYLIGNAPRTQALNLRNPGSQNLNASLQRTFPIRESIVFIFQADCTNVWNKVTFGGPSAGWSAGSTTFGQVTSASGNPRDWQFSGHLNF